MRERDPQRFFSLDQKLDHAEVVRWQCEAEISKGVRCPNRVVEADHLESWALGGLTAEENIAFWCLVHHFLKHLLDEDIRSANLIKSRMNQDQINQLRNMGYNV